MIPFPYLSAFPTGSRFTCTPAVLGTDEDWLVLVEDLDAANGVLGAADYLGNTEWTSCTDQYGSMLTEEIGAGGNLFDGWRFTAWRRGDVNLIVTADRVMYLRSVGATLLAQRLNLRDKEDRVDLFRALKFGDRYQGPLP